jgi:hypothetical protein
LAAVMLTVEFDEQPKFKRGQIDPGHEFAVGVDTLTCRDGSPQPGTVRTS